MNGLYLRVWKNCRWCGKAYQASKPVGKDGFCHHACKQAHHRAYKKYVTAKQPAAGGAQTSKVTRKKPKKRPGKKDEFNFCQFHKPRKKPK